MDGDLRPVHEARRVVPDASLYGDLAGLEKTDGGVVARAGVDDRYVGALGGELLELPVQLPDGQGAGVYSNQVMTSFC